MRYFFHVENGAGRSPDEEGHEFASLAEARAHAVDGIRSILAEEVLAGRIDLSGRVEVTDAAGAELCRVQYREALSVVGA